MNIYNELKADHKKVIALLEQLTQTDPKHRNKWDGLIEKIRDELIPHARAEEAILYNCLRAADEGTEVVRHAYNEHLQAEALLRSLQATEVVNIHWKSGVEKLKESLQHHINEEEGKIFAVARKVFSEEEAQMMGKAFKEMKPQIRKKSLLGTTLDMLTNLMPMRFQEPMKTYLKAS